MLLWAIIEYYNVQVYVNYKYRLFKRLLTAGDALNVSLWLFCSVMGDILTKIIIISSSHAQWVSDLVTLVSTRVLISNWFLGYEPLSLSGPGLLYTCFAKWNCHGPRVGYT